MITFQQKKVKPLHKYCPAAAGTAFSRKFILDAKVQDSIFSKISYSGLFCNCVNLNINLKSEWVFSITKNLQKMYSQGIWSELEMKIRSLRQSWTKGCRQIHQIKQNGFLFPCSDLQLIFFQFFYRKTPKFGLRVDGWVLAIKSKHFRDFLEIF